MSRKKRKKGDMSYAFASEERAIERSLALYRAAIVEGPKTREAAKLLARIFGSSERMAMLLSETFATEPEALLADKKWLANWEAKFGPIPPVGIFARQAC